MALNPAEPSSSQYSVFSGGAKLTGISSRLQSGRTMKCGFSGSGRA